MAYNASNEHQRETTMYCTQCMCFVVPERCVGKAIKCLECLQAI